MSKADFYILPASTDLLRFACQLIDTIWKKGNTVYVHAQSADQEETLDDLLWVFRDTGFVPHERVQREGDTASPVAIGYQGPGKTKKQVLVNLSEQAPDFITSFSRVAEIVDSAVTTQLAAARLRYIKYREQGFALHHHRI